MRRALKLPVTFGLLFSFFACGGADDANSEMDPEPEVSTQPSITVRIVSPQAGSEVGRDVRVVLETDGIEIVPISPPVPGTGHHHLYLDSDVTSLSDVIPAGDPMIVHKGDGSTGHTFEGLEPGPHRIIALVANPAHIPLDPPVTDTVNFTVGN